MTWSNFKEMHRQVECFVDFLIYILFLLIKFVKVPRNSEIKMTRWLKNQQHNRVEMNIIQAIVAFSCRDLISTDRQILDDLPFVEC